MMAVIQCWRRLNWFRISHKLPGNERHAFLPQIVSLKRFQTEGRPLPAADLLLPFHFVHRPLAMPTARKKKLKPKSSIAKKSKKVPKKKPNADSKMPKKPPTAFFYFLEDFRKGYQAQNPEVKSMRDVGKAAGEKWKTMSYEEKVQYYDTATEKRAEFEKAMADYLDRKEVGEDGTSTDESSS